MNPGSGGDRRGRHGGRAARLDRGARPAQRDGRLATDKIAAAAAEANGDVVAPIVPFGYSEYFRNYPGTITLRGTTLAAVLTDGLNCLLRHGFPRIAVFNGQAGNASVLDLVTRRFRRTRGT